MSNRWYLRGRLVIKVKGPRLERFINNAVQAGVSLYAIERLSQEMIVATVGAGSFHRLHHLTHAGPWRVTILRRLGLPFALHRLARRQGMLIGAGLAAITLYALSSFVWFVNVEGAVDVPTEKILAVARLHGLKPGISKLAFSDKVVERELLLTLDRLAWVNVELRGTLATISVAEKAVPDVTLSVPGDVVAARDGVLEEVVPLQGIPVVAKGDTVQEGQLLISGLIPPQDPSHQVKVDKGEAPYVHANGIIKAQVWHEGYAEAGLVAHDEIPTGRVNRRLVWQWRGVKGSWGKEAPFTNFQEKLYTLHPGIGRWRLPGVAQLEVRREVETVFSPLDADRAKEEALAAAWEQVKAMMPEGAQMHQPAQVTIETVGEGDGEVVRARVVVATVENIGVFRPVSKVGSAEGVFRNSVSVMETLQPVPGP